MCLGVSPVLVFKKSGPRFHSAADLYHGVSLLPTGGRPVLQLLLIPQTGKSSHGRLVMFSAIRTVFHFQGAVLICKMNACLLCFLLLE